MRFQVFVGMPLVLTVALSAGCSPEPPGPDAPPPALKVNVPDGDFDFSAWPATGPHGDPLVWMVAGLCEPPRTEEDRAARRAAADRLAKERGERGPHFHPVIVVRTNPEVWDAFQARAAPMPLGTVVVKEKHRALNTEDHPVDEYAVMVKREPGYDPGNGDWEYRYVERAEKKVERGRLAYCVDCHKNVAAQDYLFRTYLKPAGEGK
jgi:Cytochrome P460